MTPSSRSTTNRPSHWPGPGGSRASQAAGRFSGSEVGDAWGVGELCSPGTIAGGSEPSQGSEVGDAWGVGELCSPRTIAGGSEPSQGSEVGDAWGVGELCSPGTIAG